MNSKYIEYLQSEAWRNRRLGCLIRYGYKCAACESSYRLEIHHLTYDRLYSEPLDDLMPLCKEHHLTAELLIERGLLSRSGAAAELKFATIKALKPKKSEPEVKYKGVEIEGFPRPRNRIQEKLMGEFWFCESVKLPRNAFKKKVHIYCAGFSNTAKVKANAFIIYDRMKKLGTFGPEF